MSSCLQFLGQDHEYEHQLIKYLLLFTIFLLAKADYKLDQAFKACIYSPKTV